MKQHKIEILVSLDLDAVSDKHQMVVWEYGPKGSVDAWA